MRLQSSLRNASLGFATAAFLAAGAWALPAPAQNSSSSTASSSSSWLAGGTARLDHALNSRTAKQGQTVEAKLHRDVKMQDGTVLPGGTELRGIVSAVQPASNGGPSSLSLRFNEAVLKDGKTVPVKVTVIGAYPNDENQLAMYDESSMGSAPRHVSPKDRFDQEPGMLSHVAMKSRVSGHNSATFSNKKGDVNLRNGTFFQVAIAHRTNTNMSSGM
ncbi:MAG: hypothetical protein ACLGXA_03405 [Acidobacteriota bacterium]